MSTATIVAGMTAVQITEANRAHEEVTNAYRTYHSMDQAYKKLIIDTFKDLFLSVLSNETVGYANRASLELITNLLTYYAMITPTELTQNHKWLNTPYDPTGTR
jgi:23S rRNA G2069 N7-methylase RlmK/C1962 C5-methylase RlmI